MFLLLGQPIKMDLPSRMPRAAVACPPAGPSPDIVLAPFFEGAVYNSPPESLSHGGRHSLSARTGSDLAGNGPVNSQWDSHRESIAIRGALSRAEG